MPIPLPPVSSPFLDLANELGLNLSPSVREELQQIARIENLMQTSTNALMEAVGSYVKTRSTTNSPYLSPSAF